MPKTLLKYGLTLISLFILVQVYISSNHQKKLEKDKKDLAQIKDVQEVLYKLKNNSKEHMAFAAVINDKKTYVYGYATNHITQESANKKALYFCEEQRKNEKISKECSLFNSLIN